MTSRRAAAVEAVGILAVLAGSALLTFAAWLVSLALAALVAGLLCPASGVVLFVAANRSPATAVTPPAPLEGTS